MKEAFASELRAKDATIQILDHTCNEKDATINAPRSDMAKTSSTYTQDSYVKRKEIAKLKQQNAEHAPMLRVLEKGDKDEMAAAMSARLGDLRLGRLRGIRRWCRRRTSSTMTGRVPTVRAMRGAVRGVKGKIRRSAD
ncbi:hypothetical protein ACHAW5_005053 [Stephanodiscus triporus]|uniref:Uncharacterized protein n=1 Tax=Stephanodiscus triporus TaxID=2934178 RepID=A0ABD3NAG4_9STRA